MLLNANALPTDPRTCRGGTRKSRQDGPRDHHRRHRIFRFRDVIWCSGAQSGGWNKRSLEHLRLTRALSAMGKFLGNTSSMTAAIGDWSVHSQKALSLPGTCRHECRAIVPLDVNQVVATTRSFNTGIASYFDTFITSKRQ
jgi:hypothetical protein